MKGAVLVIALMIAVNVLAWFVTKDNPDPTVFYRIKIVGYSMIIGGLTFHMFNDKEDE